jgi:ribosomal protein eL43
MGRYGARVGRKIRHEARKVEDELKKPKSCPRCGKPNVKRNASGIWTCRSCSLIFAGGAYTMVAVRKTAEVSEEKAVEKKEVRKTAKEAVKEASPEEEPVEESPKKAKAKKSKKTEEISAE